MEVRLDKTGHVFNLIPGPGKITIDAAERKFQDDPTFVFMVEEEIAGPLEAVSQQLNRPSSEVLKTAITSEGYLKNPKYILEFNQYERLKSFLRATSKRSGKTLSDLLKMVPVTPKAKVETSQAVKTEVPKVEAPVSGGLYTEDELKRLTVPVLRDILKQNRLPTSGLKAVIVSRILENKIVKTPPSQQTTPQPSTQSSPQPPQQITTPQPPQQITTPQPPQQTTSQPTQPSTEATRALEIPIPSQPAVAPTQVQTKVTAIVTPLPTPPHLQEPPAPTPSISQPPITTISQPPATTTIISQPPIGIKYTKEELGKMRVPELRELLKSRNIKSTGLKAELVDRILNSNIYKEFAREVPLLPLVSPETTLPKPTPKPAREAVEELTPTEVVQNIRTAIGEFTKENLKNLRVVDLKEILKTRKLHTSGLKAVLIDRIVESEKKAEEKTEEKAEKIEEKVEEKVGKAKEKVEEEEPEEEPIGVQEKIDPNHDRFMFFSGSKNMPPGSGVDEFVNDPSEYEVLSQIKDWRKMLSNFWMQPFELDDLHWNSVEHYYQGSKFKEGHPEFFKLFSIESGSDISKDPALAKAAGGKSGVSKGRQLRPKNITVDPDFFSSENQTEAFKVAMLAKFGQNEDLLEALSATGDAYLQHKTRGVPLHRIKVLEEVRSILNELEEGEIEEEGAEEGIELTEESLNELPLTEIKAIAQSLGLPITGKKPDLIKSILESTAEREEIMKEGESEGQLKDLPVEKINEICQFLDNKSLSNFMKTSSKIRQVCGPEMTRRINEEAKRLEQEERNRLSKMNTFDLLGELEVHEKAQDKTKVTEIYKILQERSIGVHGDDSIQDDFWREVYSESPDWVIEIVSNIRPLTIHDIHLVSSDQMFETLLSRPDLNMEGYEAVIESLEDEQTERNNNRIRLIRQVVNK